MRNHWFIAALILGLALGAASRVDAAVQTGCDANGEFIVDNVVNPASSIADGYLNKTCNLKIMINATTPMDVVVTPAVVNWKATAKSITLLGNGTNQLTLINTLANSKVQLLAQNGNIFIQFATVKAKDLLNFDCSGTLCRVDIDDSIIIASHSLDVFNIPGDPGSGFSTNGDININTVGEIDVQRSTVWGGAGLHWNSKQAGSPSSAQAAAWARARTRTTPSCPPSSWLSARTRQIPARSSSRAPPPSRMPRSCGASASPERRGPSAAAAKPRFG